MRALLLAYLIATLVMPSRLLFADDGKHMSSVCAFAMSDLIKRGVDGLSPEERASAGANAIAHLQLLEDAIESDMQSSLAAERTGQLSGERPPVSAKDDHGLLASYEIGDRSATRGGLSEEDYTVLKQRVGAVRKSLEKEGNGLRDAGYFSTSDHEVIKSLLETMEVLTKIKYDSKLKQSGFLTCVLGAGGTLGLAAGVGAVEMIGNREATVDRAILKEAGQSVAGTVDKHLELYRGVLNDLKSKGTVTDQQIESAMTAERNFFEAQAKVGNTPRFGARDIAYAPSNIARRESESEYSLSMEAVTRWERQLAYREPGHVNQTTLNNEFSAFRREKNEHPDAYEFKGVFSHDELRRKGEKYLGLSRYGATGVEFAAGLAAGGFVGAAACKKFGGTLVARNFTKIVKSEGGQTKPELPGPMEKIREIAREVYGGKPTTGFAKQHYMTMAVLPTGEHLALVLTVDRSRAGRMTLTAIDTKVPVSYVEEEVPLPKLKTETVAEKEEAPAVKAAPHDATKELQRLRDSVINRHFTRVTREEKLKEIREVFDTALRMDLTEAELQAVTQTVKDIRSTDGEVEILARFGRVLSDIRGTRPKK